MQKALLNFKFNKLRASVPVVPVGPTVGPLIDLTHPDCLSPKEPRALGPGRRFASSRRVERGSESVVGAPGTAASKSWTQRGVDSKTSWHLPQQKSSPKQHLRSVVMSDSPKDVQHIATSCNLYSSTNLRETSVVGAHLFGIPSTTPSRTTRSESCLAASEFQSKVPPFLSVKLLGTT